MAVFVNEAVPFARASGPSLGGAEGTGLVVLLAIALPSTELVLPLDDEALHQVVFADTSITSLIASISFFVRRTDLNLFHGGRHHFTSLD